MPTLKGILAFWCDRLLVLVAMITTATSKPKVSAVCDP